MSLLLLFGGAAAPAQVYLHARANYARAGATRAGYYVPSLSVKVGGTDRTAAFRQAGFVIETAMADQPAQLSAQVRDFTPGPGNEVLISLDGAGSGGELLFGGHIIRNRFVAAKASDNGRYDVTATDYRWRLDLHDLVTKRYDSKGINTILADILATFTSGSFKVGYCPQSLGSATISFEMDPPSEAISRLASIAGAYWFIDPERHVYLYETLPDGNEPTLNPTDTDFWAYSYARDYAQVRTRALIGGRSTTVSSPVTAGASEIYVEDFTPFDDGSGNASGYALAANQVIRFTSANLNSLVIGGIPASGTGAIQYDLDAGETIRVVGRAVGTSAETNLLARFGDATQATYYADGGDIANNDAQAEALVEVGAFGEPVERVQYRTRDRFVRPGQQLTVNSIGPLSSTQLRIQKVTITNDIADSASDHLGFVKDVEAAPVKNDGDRYLGR